MADPFNTNLRGVFPRLRYHGICSDSPTRPECGPTSWGLSIRKDANARCHAASQKSNTSRDKMSNLGLTPSKVKHGSMGKWLGSLVTMAANSLRVLEYVRCQIASASKMGMPQRSARWQQMAACKQNGNAPALSAMAANGRGQSKWEISSAQCNSSEWSRASKMGCALARQQRVASAG
jgi:hypothetical protein